MGNLDKFDKRRMERRQNRDRHSCREPVRHRAAITSRIRGALLVALAACGTGTPDPGGLADETPKPKGDPLQQKIVEMLEQNSGGIRIDQCSRLDELFNHRLNRDLSHIVQNP